MCRSLLLALSFSRFVHAESIGLLTTMIDPTILVAQTACALLFFQGGISQFVPDTTLRQYGVPNTPRSRHFMIRTGTALLSVAILAYLMVLRNTSLETALGIVRVFWILEVLRTFLSGEATATGLDNIHECGILSHCLFVAYATLGDTSQSWKDVAIKMDSAVAFLNGFIMIINPSAACGIWGASSEDTSSLFMMRNYGYFLVALGIFTGYLAFGDENVSAVEALGYSWCAYLASSIGANFVTKEVVKFGMPRGSQYFWMLVHVVVIGALLLV